MRNSVPCSSPTSSSGGADEAELLRHRPGRARDGARRRRGPARAMRRAAGRRAGATMTGVGVILCCGNVSVGEEPGGLCGCEAGEWRRRLEGTFCHALVRKGHKV